MNLNLFFSFFVVNCVVASISLQETFSRGLQLLSQLIQPDSHLSSAFENLQARLSEPPKSPKGEEDEGVSGFWSTLLKSFGMHSKQVPAAGINVLLFLAELVSNAFTIDSDESQKPQKGGLLEVLISQQKISRLLSTMQSPKLSEIALQEAESKLSDQSSDCVMQLLCRGFPIINGMQTSLAFFLNKDTQDTNNQSKGESGSSDSTPDQLSGMKLSWKQQTPIDRFFFFMPSLIEFHTAGKLCKQKYNDC